jgi:hypothetical protein
VNSAQNTTHGVVVAIGEGTTDVSVEHDVGAQYTIDGGAVLTSDDLRLDQEYVNNPNPDPHTGLSRPLALSNWDKAMFLETRRRMVGKRHLRKGNTVFTLNSQGQWVKVNVIDVCYLHKKQHLVFQFPSARVTHKSTVYLSSRAHRFVCVHSCVVLCVLARQQQIQTLPSLTGERVGMPISGALACARRQRL